eukprot:scaffold16720_cov75-Phaeocystis_antarctica.AAC.2
MQAVAGRPARLPGFPAPPSGVSARRPEPPGEPRASPDEGRTGVELGPCQRSTLTTRWRLIVAVAAGVEAVGVLVAPSWSAKTLQANLQLPLL